MTLSFTINAQSSKPIKFSGKWFLAYDWNKDASPEGAFLLKRGYFTAKKDIDSRFSFRLTYDVAVDKEGDGVGDIETRIKYGYLKYSNKKAGGFSDLYVEAGVVHRPWIDFEQKINHYRVQGSMYLERIRVLRSADFGVMIGGLFGSKMDTTYQKNVNKNNAGRYGSFAAGVFNGGGYEAIEENDNKYAEGRATLRPVPDAVPGLQISFVGGYGKGNIEEAPDFSFAAAFLSHETKHTVLTATYYRGTGDLFGRVLDSTRTSLDRNGYSVFAETSFGKRQLKAFGRYDFLTTDSGFSDDENKRYIAGLAYEFAKSTKILVTVDHLQSNQPATKDKTVSGVALEVNF